MVVKGTYWILEWSFDQKVSSIHQQVKLDYVDTGAHIAPHCGVTNAKLRASIPVSFIINLLFCWICHHFSSCSFIRKLQLTWAFSQLTMTGKMHKGAYGEWSFKQRVADQILEVPITALSALFFQFFSSYFCILINKWPVNNILFLCAHLQDIPKKC